MMMQLWSGKREAREREREKVDFKRRKGRVRREMDG
jgi:hypothetical protein